MPRHKLEVTKLLIIATEPVETVILNVLGPFPNFSRKGSTRDLLSLLDFDFCVVESLFVE